MIVLTFLIIISVVIIQRLIELFISRKNEIWLLNNGAVEFGHSHYKTILMLHILFFVSMSIEFFVSPQKNIFLIPLILILLLQIFRIRIILSLGKFWNTKIYRIPGSQLINTGLYKYIKHPNYIIVFLEILILPLIFGLYVTSILFTILNIIVLSNRIKIENIALKSL